MATIDINENSESTIIYELAFIISEKEHEALIKSYLERLGAKILFTKESQKINLAYPILGNTTGYFGFYNFELESGKADTLRKELKLVPQVIRFMLLRWSELAVRQNVRLYGKREQEVLPAKDANNALTNEALEAKLQEMLKE